MDRIYKKKQLESLRRTALQERQPHMELWSLIGEYLAPGMVVKRAGESERSLLARKVLDNHAQRASRIFESGFFNGATPKGGSFFNLTVSDTALARTAEVRRILEKRKEALSAKFHMSNLYTILPLVYHDLGNFSNAAFAQLPHPKYGMYFYYFPIGSYAYNVNEDGDTNYFTRDVVSTVGEVVKKYGRYDLNGKAIWDNIPKRIRAKYDRGDYLDKVILTNQIIENPAYSRMQEETILLDPSVKRYQSYTYVDSYIEEGTGPKESVGFRDESQVSGDPRNEFISVGGYGYFPVMTPRWRPDARSAYGVFGPGHVAISDVLSLQAAAKDRFDTVDKILRPPTVAPASMRRHQTSILAGGITFVDTDDMNKIGIKPIFEVPPNMAPLLDVKEELKQAIDESYMVNIFMMLSGTEVKTHVTEREIDVRAGERASILNPVLGQFDKDLGSKVISNGQYIMEDQGQLDPLPDYLRAHHMVGPEYTSPLAQAAKVAQITAMERVMAFTVSAADALGDQTLKGILKGEEMIREYAHNSALPADQLASPQEFQKIKQDIQEAQALAAQEERQMRAVQAAKLMGETPTTGDTVLSETLNGGV